MGEDPLTAFAARDPVMAALVERHGPPRLGARRSSPGRSPRRSGAGCGGVVPAFTPEAVLGAGYEALRGAGLSGAKAASVLDLAAKAADGTVRLDRIGRLDGDAIVEHLTVVRGIGRWLVGSGRSALS